MPRRSFAASGQKIQYSQALRDGGALLGCCAGSLQKLIEPAIGLAGARIVMALQELGVGAQGNRIVRSVGRSLPQAGQRLFAVAAAFQAPSGGCPRGQVLAGSPSG